MTGNPSLVTPGHGRNLFSLSYLVLFLPMLLPTGHVFVLSFQPTHTSTHLHHGKTLLPQLTTMRKPTVSFSDKTAENVQEVINQEDSIDIVLEEDLLSPITTRTSTNTETAASSYLRRLKRALITDIDAPLRLHASSAVLYSVGSFAWLMGQLYLIMTGTLEPLGAHLPAEIDYIILVSALGLILTGQQYLPKGPRYKYYRTQFIATGWIMIADMLLWLWFSGTLANTGAVVEYLPYLMAPLVGSSLAGDISFIVLHDVTRKEFYDRGFIADEFQKPGWSLTVWATHIVLFSLKSWGFYHVLMGGTPWLQANPGPAAFGAALFMSTSMVASWSAFTQGTMVLRKTPAFGKKVFILVNDLTTWAVFIGCFLPLAAAAQIGHDSATLQQFFSF